MSASNQTAGPSTDNFTAIFNAASNEYQRVTGKSLHTHPFAAKLDNCHSPEAISNVFRTQAQAISDIQKDNEKLMTWLEPMINILSIFSDTLGEGISLHFSPAKTIFTGIGALLGVVKDVINYDTLIRLFERISFFFQRLNSYTKIPLTEEFTVLLGKIFTQLLSILAISEKEITDGMMKRVLARLVGKKDIDDALQQLNVLTNEENLMAVTRNLEVSHQVDGNVKAVKEMVHNVGGNVEAIADVIWNVNDYVTATKVLTENVDVNVKVIQGITRGVDYNVKATKHAIDEVQRNQLKEKLRAWLPAPDPSTNHNIANKAQHGGSARWFIQGSTFRDWQMNGSLLWVNGNPGAGKSILCSAIIEDIKNMREAGSALMAYYYFDFKDTSKRDVYGFLKSVLSQLGDGCDRCWDVLHRLYAKCRNGSEQPSDTALAGCLKKMLELPGQLPIFIIVDALDECPNTTGSPSAREEVLNFVEDLVRSNYSNSFICVTSRPEQDIRTVLTPLTSASRRVSLHEENGQRDDIDSYIRSFVRKDKAMRRWREDDRQLVIGTLSHRANGMFRWACCQLDSLRRCIPSSIRKALDELPTTLDDTYERALQGIPKEKWHHAHRLFQCLVAAVRPLRVKELAEVFTLKFGPDGAPSLMESWRPENPEEALLSTCSTLIAIVEDAGPVIQFSHFSVKEYLTSDRLRNFKVGNLCDYYIPLDEAHTTLARACLAVLLQLDERVDSGRLATFPLARYAAQHWLKHAEFEGVAMRIQYDMERLFNPRRPYLAAWVWVHDVDPDSRRRGFSPRPKRPSPPKATALYYASLCGFGRLADYLVCVHREDINAESSCRKTPLHAASYKGHVETARVLLHHGANMKAKDEDKKTPLCSAYDGGHLEVMRLLLERGVDVDVEHGYSGPISHYASGYGQVEVVRLLLKHGADVNSKDYYDSTPLYEASRYGHPRVVQLLLDHGAGVNALTMDHETPLCTATGLGSLEVVKLLLRHGADMSIRDDDDRTPYQIARSRGFTEIAQLLLDYGAKE